MTTEITARAYPPVVVSAGVVVAAVVDGVVVVERVDVVGSVTGAVEVATVAGRVCVDGDVAAVCDGVTGVAWVGARWVVVAGRALEPRCVTRTPVAMPA